MDAAGIPFDVEDQCHGEHYVKEGRCPTTAVRIGDQLGYYFLAHCPKGCRDGACVR